MATDFLLELLSEEIPARMQAKARDDLARLFADEIGRAGLKADALETFATPRRLALIARGLPDSTAAVSDETKGPRASAPPQALEGFLRKTGLAREDLVERDGVLFAVVEKPGRATIDVLAEAIPALVRAFPWPKSMRWGAASADMGSPRWVRPLRGIVALFGEQVVPCEVAGVASGAATLGHRFHHPGPVTIGSAEDYAVKLRACHVIVDQAEREAIVRDGAARAAEAAGLALVPDEGLVIENAGLTEWPVPLLGRFDPAFLKVPREVIQLTMRTNQKYFSCVQKSSPERGGGPAQPVEGVLREAQRPVESSLHHPADDPPPRAGEELAPAFVCTANIEAKDGGAAIVAGNAKVLAARLSDARFFWEQDLRVPLAEQAKKLDRIVFHEKLGTVADKVERVAKLARWLVEEGIVKSSPARGGGPRSGGGGSPLDAARVESPLHHPADGPPPRAGEELDALADMAEQAARLAKADLVTGMVGEFPELQGVMGGYYARAEGLPPEVADAIRDHYKPVGQGDDVPTAHVTVAVSLADKLDTFFAFFAINEPPTGSRDPFALRRQVLSILAIAQLSHLMLPLWKIVDALAVIFKEEQVKYLSEDVGDLHQFWDGYSDTPKIRNLAEFEKLDGALWKVISDFLELVPETGEGAWTRLNQERRILGASRAYANSHLTLGSSEEVVAIETAMLSFAADRLKVQQREAGVRHDLIDAVFALGGEDDLVRLLARVKALQAFVGTEDGANLLAGYKRAANILAKEGYDQPSPRIAGGGKDAGGGEGERESGEAGGLPVSLAPAAPVPPPASGGRADPAGYSPLPEEESLRLALAAAEPMAAGAIAGEDFEGAMRALAGLRAPIDAFFERVTVNDPDPAKRSRRLALLARVRDAIDRVADFSKIAG